jgi:hypothetical protein
VFLCNSCTHLAGGVCGIVTTGSDNFASRRAYFPTQSSLTGPIVEERRARQKKIEQEGLNWVRNNDAEPKDRDDPTIFALTNKAGVPMPKNLLKRRKPKRWQKQWAGYV